MNKRNFKFYLAITQSLDTALGWSISDAGAIAPARDWAMAAVRHTKLEGEGLRVDLPFTDPYSAVFFYDANKQLLSMAQLKGSDLIIAPVDAEYYAIRLTTYDPAVRGAISTGVFKVVHAIYEVSPYYKKLEKRMAKDSGQNYYRESLSGQLKLVGKDFDIIYSRGIDRSFGLFIYLDGKRYFNGSFSKIDCKFDLTKKICEPKIKTSDSYTRILDRYEDKYDLVRMGLPLTPVECTKRAFVQLYCAGSNNVTNIFNGQAWEKEVLTSIDDTRSIEAAGFSEVNYLREIYVENAQLQEVNGIYTEFRQEQVEDSAEVLIYYYRWYKKVEGRRTHYIELAKGYNSGALHAKVYRVDDGQELYYVGNVSNVPLAMFNRKSNLTNLAFTSASNGVFVIRKDIAYDIYGRVVHNRADVRSGLLRADDFAMSNISYKRISPLSDNGYLLNIAQSSDSTDKDSHYGINDYGAYFTPEFLPSVSDESKYTPVIRSSWVNTSIWLAYNPSTFKEIEQFYNATFNIRDCFNIGHVISGLLNKIGLDIAHEPSPEYSSFLYAATSPLPDTKNFSIYITHKSNAVRGTYDQAAQKAEVSLKTIMDMLRDCFRCYWYIEDRKLKIEHISFFKNGLSYVPDSSCTDLTLLNDKYNGKPVLYGQGSVEYDISEFSRKYNLAYSGENQVPFSGVSLEVDASYVQADKVEDINVGEFSADLDYMQISADSVSQDGFALLCPQLIGQPDSFLRYYRLPISEIVLLDNGKSYKTKIQNPYASWAYLARLYSFDMPGEHITSNVFEPFTASGLKEGLLQTVLIPEVPGLRPYDAVKTDLGTARIKSVSENLDSGYMTLELAYPLG